MKTKIYNIEIKRGADYLLELKMSDSNRNPVDLTNYTWAAQVRQRPESAIAYDFVITTVPTLGQISLFIPWAVTTNMMFSDGVYDLFFINQVTGERNSLIQGKVNVVWKVTEI